MTGRLRAPLAVLGLIALLGGGPRGPVPLAAHALVLESTPANNARLPAPPAEMRIRFNGRIEHALSRATLTPVRITPAGGTAPSGAAVSLPVRPAEHAGRPAPDRIVLALPALAPGTYLVRWKVLAADGHITDGTLRFTIEGSR
ncbi:MAG: copper resistance protein CopC [Candidatus Rokubacteria bacterium]|nr:copper resistance protein CopC [Candidatus Rokubacteria bacterium]